MNLIEKWNEAFEFAKEKHKGQIYGGRDKWEKIPYYAHLVDVAMVISYELTNDLDWGLAIQVALLHDVLEDTDVTYEELVGIFEGGVANGVLALTKDNRLNDQMIDSLRRIKMERKEIWMIKMADRICNLRYPPYFWSLEKRKRYRDEAQMIHDELCDGHTGIGIRLQGSINEYSEAIDVFENFLNNPPYLKERNEV